jgi:3D (Asp-Asp-Asp) domain-containing protein
MMRLILSLLMLCVFPVLSLAREKMVSADSKATQARTKAAAPERIVAQAVVASSKKTSALAGRVEKVAAEGKAAIGGRLARLTAYWSGEGDYYTRRHLSSTGVRLHEGHCAVDPSVIPYGSVVQIAGLGNYLAVDTGTAVVSRRAARVAGHTSGERNALVIDLYFDERSSGEEFAAHGPKYASISWCKPDGDVVLGRSAVMTDQPASVPAPAAKPETRVAAVKTRGTGTTKSSSSPFLPEPASAQASAKPSLTPTAKLASIKPPAKAAAQLASAKPVGKHDTQDTRVASSTANLKGASKLTPFKTPSTTDLKATAQATAKPLQDEAAGHILIAQTDHKALYQF